MNSHIVYVGRMGADDINVLMDMALAPIFRYLPADAIDRCKPKDLAGVVEAMSSHLGGAFGRPRKGATGVGTGTEAGWTTSDLVARVERIFEARSALKRLMEIPLIPQRSDEWFNMRKQRLTASDIATALGKGKYSTREKLVYKKVMEGIGRPLPFKSSPPTQWGVMFEPMAARTYAQHRGETTLHEFGLLPHPSLPCFGASPDNISDMGIMVEYKCPYRRAITGEIPVEYALQMQGQMAVCGIAECDYVECGMERLRSEEEYCETFADKRRGHGVILEFEDHARKLHYEYSPEDLTGAEAVAWGRKTASEIMNSVGHERWNLSAMVFWRLKTLNIVRVYFNPESWQELVPKIEEFWQEVERGRAEAEAKLAMGEELPEEPAGPYEKARRTLNLDIDESEKAADAGSSKPPKKKFVFLADSDIES